MPEEYIKDMILLCDGVVKEHGTDWKNMTQEEKREWIEKFVRENAHPI